MRKTRIIFRDEDMMCETCEGHGTTIEKDKSSFLRSTCPKCGGVGKLDWISNAMGVQEEEEDVRVSSSSVSRTSSSHSHTMPSIHTHKYPNITGNNSYLSGPNPVALDPLPNLAAVGANGESLVIKSDSLEIDCNHLILNEDMLDSLVNIIEQKLKEREE